MYKILVERFYNGQAAIATVLEFYSESDATVAYKRLNETTPKNLILSTIITCLY